MEDFVVIVLIFGGATACLLAISPVGRAIAGRIQHGAAPRFGFDPNLADEVERLRQEVAELQERVDFAERLLSKSNDLAGSASALPDRRITEGGP